MANRLAEESSPYLLQHANNPVDWYPWGPEAFELAKREDKPIFLSIGYSACHWCHVMEHESFEDTEIAAQLNELFVCVKVDREERPDLDQIYMNAVQLMTGRGGWPMSVFLTPSLEPFYGGTYWPPAPRQGIPGFPQVLAGVAEAWSKRRSAAIEQAGKLTAHLRAFSAGESANEAISDRLLGQAVNKLQATFDSRHGGFGGAPKFPHAMDLRLLLQRWASRPVDDAARAPLLEMVTVTLDRMAQGGIYDHLGGGFARYSVDARWLVPHFEKMLYDNSLLISTYLDAFLVTGNARYAEVARETIEYILRDMTAPEGGFYSTEDADSEGEEGKFYVWSPEEIRQVLGDARAARFCQAYDVTPAGNFEGRNILNLPVPLPQLAAQNQWDLAELETELAASRATLLAAREQRVHPAKDDKILVSWNGLMIEALATAAGVLDAPHYYDAAARAARFLLSRLRDKNGRLLHCWRHGAARLPAYLDGYAYLTNALVSLYEARFDESWIDEAVGLAELMLEHFSDHEGGGFFFTADDHEVLITRTKDLHDASVPSGNAMAATALLRLGRLCGRNDFLAAAEGTLEMASHAMARQPAATGQMLIAANMWLQPSREITLLVPGEDSGTARLEQLGQRFHQRFLVNYGIAGRTTGDPDSTRSQHLAALFQGKMPADNEPHVYVCENFACQAPIRGDGEIATLLNRLAADLR